MHREQFEALINEFIDEELKLLGWKRTEYTSTEDVLQNFKQNADFLGMTPEEVCMVYMTKHYQSIVLAVKSGRFNWVWETEEGSEGLKQRFADMVNYAHLLAAIIDEKVTQGMMTKPFKPEDNFEEEFKALEAKEVAKQ